MKGSSDETTRANGTPAVGTRDHLALRRTELAVERTFLAYVRTAIAITAGAVGLPLLFGGQVARVSAWALAAVAIIVFVWGLKRLRAAKRWIEEQSRLAGCDTER